MTQQHNAATWRISQVALNVDDLEAAIAFYRDTLRIRPSRGLLAQPA